MICCTSKGREEEDQLVNSDVNNAGFKILEKSLVHTKNTPQRPFKKSTSARLAAPERNSTTSDPLIFFVTEVKSDIALRHRACGPPSVGLTLR